MSKDSKRNNPSPARGAARAAPKRAAAPHKAPTSRLSAGAARRPKKSGAAPQPGLPSALAVELLDTLSTGVIAVDNSGRSIYVNPAFCRLLGWPASELTGVIPPFVHWSDRHTDEPGGSLGDALAEREASHRHAGLEGALLARDGRRIPVSLSVAPLRSAGRTSGFVATVAPMQERIAEQHQVEENTSLLRAITEHIEEVIYVFDNDNDRIISVSPAYERIWGRSTQSLLDSAHSFVDAILAPGRQAMIDSFEPSQREHPSSLEYEVQRPDGSRSWIWDRNFPLRMNGRFWTVGIAADITERKRTEELLRRNEAMLQQAQELASIGAWRTDYLRNTANWTAQMYRILDYPMPDPVPLDASPRSRSSDFHLPAMPRAEHERRLLVERLHPEDRNVIAVEKLRQGGNHFFHARIVLPSGRTRHVETHYQVVPDAAGKALYALGVMQDVTERVEHNNMLTQLQKLDALGQLSGGMAHDLNNVLAIVIGNLGDIAREAGESALPASVTEGHERAMAAALRGAELLESLLSFARKQPGVLRDIAIHRHLRNLLPVLRFVLGPRIELVDEIADGPQLIRMDASAFDSSILNLVINARDAIGEHGGRVCLRTSAERTLGAADAARQHLNEGRYVEVSIQDSGAGMSEEVLQHACDPYFTTKPEGQGTGLGLPMVWSFARQAHGTLSLASRPGEGTTVNLLLPCDGHALDPDVSPPPDSADDVDNRVATQAVTAAVPHAAARELAILLVDDEPELRRLGERILSRRGHAVTAVADAAEARAAMQTNAFDIMVTDLVMPGSEDGVSLSHWATETRPAMKIINVSGYSKKSMSQKLPWLFLQKPYLPQQLIDIVEGAMAGSSQSG
jgi:PAS domain S-box-containing protein